MQQKAKEAMEQFESASKVEKDRDKLAQIYHNMGVILRNSSDKFPWLTEPNVSYHGVSFARDCAPAAFVTYIRAILLRDTGATISPVHSLYSFRDLRHYLSELRDMSRTL